MDILNNFGFEPVLFAAQIVNFLIILYLLQRFALKPILKVLEDRKGTIAEGLRNAETAEQTLQKALSEERKILATAQTASDKLIDDAKKQAKELMTTARSDAKEQVEEIVASARAEMSQERKRLEKELALSVAKTAVSMIEKTLEGMIEPKEQEEIIKKFTEKVKKLK